MKIWKSFEVTIYCHKWFPARESVCSPLINIGNILPSTQSPNLFSAESNYIYATTSHENSNNCISRRFTEFAGRALRPFHFTLTILLFCPWVSSNLFKLLFFNFLFSYRQIPILVGILMWKFIKVDDLSRLIDKSCQYMKKKKSQWDLKRLSLFCAFEDA